MKTSTLKVRLIEAAQGAGCGRNGAQLGPQALREAGLMERLKGLNLDIEEGTVLVNDPTIPTPDQGPLKNIEPIKEFNERLCDVLHKSLQQGEFPLVIGGDHSLAIGSISGASRHFGAEALGVIWVDAHADINTATTSPTGNIHGMSLAALLGYGEPALAQMCGPEPKLRAEQVTYIATRDIDPGEREVIQRKGIPLFSVEQLQEQGAESVARALQEHLERLSAPHLYLSLDIDALDATLVPGTGTPVAGGITWEQLQPLLRAILQTGKLRALELVEVNPLLDQPDHRTSRLAVEILEYLFTNLLKP